MLRTAKTDFEIVELEDDWVGARIPKEWMTELTRTPTYLARQEEDWQFCCERPMVYVGEWDENEFNAHTPDGDGRAMFDAIVQDAEDYLWEAMDKGKLHDDFGIYVFRCPVCESYRAHWDMY